MKGPEVYVQLRCKPFLHWYPFHVASVVFEFIIKSFLFLAFHVNVGKENIILYILYAVILFDMVHKITISHSVMY